MLENSFIQWIWEKMKEWFVQKPKTMQMEKGSLLTEDSTKYQNKKKEFEIEI